MRKIIYFILILCAVNIFYVARVNAATITFEAQDSTLGTDQPFTVAINLDADKPVNALSLVFDVPLSFVPIDSSDGNSIINFWLEKPHYDSDKHTLSFSGIIPGGFSGKQGRLVEISFRAQSLGEVMMNINKSQSKIILNSKFAVEDEIVSTPFSLHVVAGKQNISVNYPDTESPEAFEPIVTKHTSLNQNQWTLIFETQDKGSGIDKYQVQESFYSTPEDDKWHDAESSFVLQDQERHSYIFVKAIDKKGNFRIAQINPEFPLAWYQINLKYIIVVFATIVLLILFEIISRKFKHE